MRIKQLADRWAEYFLPDRKTAFQGEEKKDYFKAKLLILSCYLGAFLVSLTSLNFWINSSDMPWEGISTIIIFLGIPTLFKFTGRYKLSASLLPAIALILLPIAVFKEGGMNSQPAVWFAAVPIMSLFFLGSRLGLIFSFLAFCEVMVFTFLHINGFQFENVVVVHNLGVHYSIGIMALFLFATFLSWHYESSQNEVKNKLKTSREKALSANKTKDVFWANISHEIRTPLNGILGMTNLLLDSRLNNEQKELLEIIRDSAENLNIILGDVIDYSKLETNEIEVQKKPFEIENLLIGTLELFQHMADEKGINLSYMIDPDVPLAIMSDETRVRQILINLITNAIKFTEHGHIKILVEKGGRKNTVIFHIEDTGIGIQASKLDRLFKPFSQVDDGSSRKFGGTGLGLIICKSLVEKLGGLIKVESQYGKGSVFTFSLEAMAIKVKAHRKEAAPTRETFRVKTIDLNILVVEDNPVNQKLLVSLLNKNGFKADVANNGLEALDAADKKSYDLIFMDIQMPEMDGITATKEIFKRFPKMRPKIVAVTANVLQEDRDRCYEAGMDDFLAKPINNNVLRSVLERYSKQISQPLEVPEDFQQLVNFEGPIAEVVEEVEQEIKLDVSYPTFDHKELLDNYSNDVLLIENLIEQFIEKAPMQLESISNAIKADNAEDLEILSHSLKGSMASLFCKEGVGKSITLEKIAKTSDLKEAPLILSDLSSIVYNLTEDLSDFISKLDEEADPQDRKSA